MIQRMVTQHDINEAAQLLKASAPAGSQVVLFGSYAKGCAHEHSDIDFMVVEPEVKGWLRETDRLYRCVRQLRLPVELIVTSFAIFDRKKDVTSTVYHEAYQHGKVMDAIS